MRTFCVILFTLFLSFTNTAYAISPGGVSAGLQLWLEGSTGVTQSGGAVSAWADQSGLGNNATQGTAINKPTIVNSAVNGNPTINFDGSANYFILPTINLGHESEVFTVLKMGDNGAGRGPIIGQDSEVNYFSNDNNTWISRMGGISNSITANAPTTYSIIHQQQSDTNNLLRITNNGPDDGILGVSTSANFNIDRIGRSASTTAKYLLGNIAEMVAYNSIMTATQEAQIQSYLAIKHGITLFNPTSTTTIAESTFDNGGANDGNNTQSGQSFTAVKTTTITDIQIYGGPDVAETTTLKICNGAPATAAACVAAAIYTQNSVMNTYVLHNPNNYHLTTPLNVIAGQQYTFLFHTTVNNFQYEIGAPGSSYAGGNRYSSLPDTTTDMVFSVIHAASGIPNYLAADGATSVWTRSAAGAFDQDIAGIATDNTSGLSQTDSQSINSNSLVEIKNATAQSNGDYLMWSSNGSSTMSTSSLTISNIIYKRLSRAWYRQQTGSIGNVDIVLHTTGSAFAGHDLTKVRLLTSNATAFTGATTIAPSSVSGSDITYSGVNLTNTYFTFAEGPGEFTGTVYTDKGITNIGAGIPIKIIVNGATSTVGTTTAGGAFSIPVNTPNMGDIITFAINNGTNFGVTVTKWDASTYTGYDIYKDTLITRSDNGVPLTDTNLDTGNDGSTAVQTIYNNGGATTLNIPNNSYSLMVWPGSTFTPGGAITIGASASTGELRVDGTLDAAANAITLRGSLNVTNAGTFLHTGTLTMNGTGPVTYNQGSTTVSNSLIIQDVLGVTVTNNPLSVANLTLTSGFLYLNGQNITVSSTFTNNGTLQLNGNEVPTLTQDIDSGTWKYVGNSDGATTTYTIKDFGATDYFSLSVIATDTADTFNFTTDINTADTFNFSSGVINENIFNFNVASTYTQSVGTSTFNGGNGTTTIAGTMSMAGAGAASPIFNASSGPLVIGGNFSFAGTNSIFNGASGTMFATGTCTISNGVFTAPSTTMTVLSSFSNTTGTFNHNNGTVKFARATAGNQTVTTTGTTFYNFTKTDTLADGVALTLNFGNASTLNVIGRLTLQGNATEDLIIKTNAAANMHTINSTSGLYTINDVNVKDSTLKQNGVTKYPPLNPSSSVNVSNTFGWFGNGAIVELSTNTSGLENTGTTTPRIYVYGIVAAATTVTITDLSTGTATGGTDYTFTSPQVVTIPAGTYDGLASTSLAIPTFAINGDSLLESNETIILNISAPTGDATLGDANSDTATTTATTHTIINDDVIVQESVAISTISNASEPSTPGAFLFTLSTTSTTTLNIGYTISGTAINGTDYVTLSGTSTLSSGTTTKEILITVIDDTIVEGLENIILTITGTDNSLFIASSTASTSMVTIADDDTDKVSILKLFDASEPSTNGQFSISISNATNTAVDIGYTITGTAINGTDYSTLTGTSTLSANATSTTIIISTIDDALLEGLETITLTLTGTNKTLVTVNGASSTATVNMTDDEINYNYVSLSTISNAGEPNTSGAFLLTLSTTSTTTISVGYTISGTAINGTDYVTLSGTSTLSSGTTTKEILITVIDDLLSEGLENIILAITSTDNALFIASSTASSSAITIIDNDIPGITVTPLTINVNEVGAPATYTVVLNTQPTATTTIIMATSTANFTISTTTITFTPANWNIAQTVTIAAINLGLTSGIGTSTVTLTLNSLDSNYSHTSTTTLNININNNYTGPVAPTVLSPITNATVGSSTSVIVQCQNVGDIIKVYGNITPSPSTITCASTGTTTVSITFSTTTSPQSIGVTITDIYANVSATTTIAGLLIDSDGDSVADSVEDVGANAGDGNGDGTADKLQSQVLGAYNPATGAYSTLVAAGSCTFIKALSFVSASSLSTLDSSATYPVGLANFTVQCPLAGQSSSLTIFYTQQYATSSWLYKKYNTVAHTYTDRSSAATFGIATVGTTTVTTVAFTATDGDTQSDEDTVANNYIVDPSGPAIITPVSPSVSISSGGGGGGGIIWPAITQTQSTTTASSTKNTLKKLIDLIGGEEPNVPAEFSNYVCKRYLRSYIYTGNNNKKDEVKKLQEFLNVSQNEKLTVDGVYDDEDIAAVKRFQNKYADQILAPWGTDKATGVVGKTTVAKINIMMCSTQKGCPYFASYLKADDNSLDVVKLQDFLNIIFAPTSGYPTNALTLSKSFDKKTTKSLKEFQTVYKDIVLKPWGLASATGWFYQTSRHAANKLLECNEGLIKLDNGKAYK